MTLRGRLIAGLLALLAVSCAVVGLVTYLSVRGALLSQQEQSLAEASSRFASCVKHSPGAPAHQASDLNGSMPASYDAHGDQPGDHAGAGGPPSDQHGDDSPPQAVPGCETISGQESGTFTARLVDGRVVNASIVNNHCDPSTAARVVLAALPTDGTPVSRNMPSLHGTYLLSAVPGDGNSVLVTGLPLAAVQNTLRGVAVTEISVFVAILALAGLLGAMWVRLSFRPLRRMTAVAVGVTNLPLSSGDVDLPHRVPDADPRTEVGQLGAAFNRMLGHVESALTRRATSEERLRRFAADASHELRTPLAAIRGYAEFARRARGQVPPEVAHALSRVEAESARMSDLVDELLLLAQLDAGRPLAAEPLDLTRLAIDATSDARMTAPDHRWVLDLPDEPVLVRGDEHRLHQVLANLLSNAGKHTAPGTTVTVAMSVANDPVPAGTSARPGPGQVEVTVTDDGPGIPPDLQANLFERFVRGDAARSRASGSTGLGLAIVAAVTAAHQGRTGVTSRPGQTRFTITLPRLSPQAG
jgi:two-component system, OmpR family, sensor kinase